MRSGIWNKERFYDDLGEQISELESRPANQWQSAEQSSLDAWLEKYPLYNGPDYSVSYYTKGQVLGELLDILIRDRTNNAKSLDDVLRGDEHRFRETGEDLPRQLGYPSGGGESGGRFVRRVFSRLCCGAEPLPYQQMLALAGLDLRTIETTGRCLDFLRSADSGGT